MTEGHRVVCLGDHIHQFRTVVSVTTATANAKPLPKSEDTYVRATGRIRDTRREVWICCRKSKERGSSLWLHITVLCRHADRVIASERSSSQ